MPPGSTWARRPGGLGGGRPRERPADRPAWEEALARERHAGRAVARAQAPADADVEVAFGEVAEAILAAADDENADLIVAGSYHTGFLQRLLAGSVSQELASKAPRPVLIVREPPRPRRFRVS